jgi:hypothetical protein
MFKIVYHFEINNQGKFETIDHYESINQGKFKIIDDRCDTFSCLFYPTYPPPHFVDYQKIEIPCLNIHTYINVGTYVDGV